MPSVRKINLLFLAADKFPPFWGDTSILFARHLVGRGHKIDWLLQSEADCRQSHETRWKSSRVWVGATDNGTSRWRRLKKHLLNFCNELKIFRLTRQENYDCIVVKDKFIFTLIAIVVARFKKTKLIYWLSYPFPEDSLHRVRCGSARYPLFYFVRGRLFSVLLYRVIMPEADHVFVQSEQMKRDVIAKGILAGKLTAVPMGVEITDVPYQKDLSMTVQNDDEKKIVYIGTLTRVRKLDFLVRVVDLVRKQVPGAKLYLVGAGDDFEDEQLIINEAVRLGLAEVVVITGFLPKAAMWKYIQTADVCVSPYYPTFILNSTSPTKLIKYMAIGKAVVANDHPEQRQVLRDSAGGLCVPYREEAFADAIVALLRDPQKAAEMGQNGRKYIEQHRTYQVIADMVDHRFLQILCGRTD